MPHRSRCRQRHHRLRLETSSAVVNVERGDTLWDIVDHHYGGATAELVWATVAANPEIDDPNLIFVGQQIVLPPRPGTAVAPPAEPTEPVPPAQVDPVIESPATPTVDYEPPPSTSGRVDNGNGPDNDGGGDRERAPHAGSYERRRS